MANYESLTTTATANNADDYDKDSNSTEINDKQATTTMATYRRMFCSSNASFSSSKLTVLGDSGDDKGGIKIEQVSVVNNNNNKKQVNISIPDVDPCNNHEVDLRPGAKMLPLHKITPTVGMNLAHYNACGVECIIWDLGGKELMRPIWERYYPDCDAIIFIIDSTNTTKEMEESAKIYDSVCSHEIFKERYNNDSSAHVPKIVFMNKIDKENEYSYNTANWKRLFQHQQQQYQSNNSNGNSNGTNGKMYRNTNDDVVNVFGGSAKTGDGIRYAMEYLILAVINQKKLWITNK